MPHALCPGQTTAVFPASLVPRAAHHTGKTSLPGILAEEREWADRANIERRRSAFLWLGAGLVSLAWVTLRVANEINATT